MLHSLSGLVVDAALRLVFHAHVAHVTRLEQKTYVSLPLPFRRFAVPPFSRCILAISIINCTSYILRHICYICSFWFIVLFLAVAASSLRRVDLSPPFHNIFHQGIN